MTKGIFCLEFDNSCGQKDHSIIFPILELLERRRGIQYLHKTVATPQEFIRYVDRYMRSTHKDHPILYLASHQWPNDAFDEERTSGNTDSLPGYLEQLERGAMGGMFARKVLHLGSFGVICTNQDLVELFLQNTALLAVSSYRRTTDWINTAILDLMILDAFHNADFTIRGVARVQDQIFDQAPELAHKLQFRIHTRQR